LALLVAGCAAPTAQLSPDVLARLQRESRVEIYDRENDVVIARNREDEVRLRIARLAHEHDELVPRGKKMQERLTRAHGSGAGRIDRTVQAKRAYLAAQVKLSNAQLDLASQAVA